MIEWLRAVHAEAQEHYVRAVELSMDQFEDRTITQGEPVDPTTRADFELCN